MRSCFLPELQEQVDDPPAGLPLFDLQCTRCLFRAQVKTVSAAPRDSILGAGADIYEKVAKAGHLAPTLIVNFKWRNRLGAHQEIRFYPLIPRENIKPLSTLTSGTPRQLQDVQATNRFSLCHSRNSRAGVSAGFCGRTIPRP